MQYQLVVSTSSDWCTVQTEKEFKEKIQKLCNDGWKPQGGVSITFQYDKYMVLAQAMVK